ncbi:hypothetical protein C1646_662756 [Rhizophagus diaphanus]|nr:hypothetical protein C1646_662756 [Rhizophagus diaphanus] [Rhizophagus sp. MUCL 43196]
MLRPPPPSPSPKKDVKEGKDPDEKDKKLQRSCVWGERKFLQTVVWLGIRLKGLHNEVSANMIDESIDEVLVIKQLQNEIHRKIIKFLTDEFDVVIISPFEGARGIFLRALLDGALILSGDHAGNNSNI